MREMENLMEIKSEYREVVIKIVMKIKQKFSELQEGAYLYQSYSTITS